MSQASVSASSPVTLRQLVTPGLTAIRRYWPAFGVLQACALGLVVSYYAFPAVAVWCGKLVELKDAGGLLVTALGAAVAGALLPELAKGVALGEWPRDRQRRLDLLFALAAFALNGLITDAQYRVLAIIFGHDASWSTIVQKLLADQFITTPVYGITYWAFVYALKHNNFNLLRTVRELSPRWYVVNVLPLLIPCWAFWIPMVTLIYALPGPLQYWLFLLALASWSLIMVFIANRAPTTAPATPTAAPALPASEPTIVR